MCTAGRRWETADTDWRERACRARGERARGPVREAAVSRRARRGKRLAIDKIHVLSEQPNGAKWVRRLLRLGHRLEVAVRELPTSEPPELGKYTIVVAREASPFYDIEQDVTYYSCAWCVV